MNRQVLLLFLVFAFSLGRTMAQLSNSLNVAATTIPSLNACSGEGTYVIRVNNITGSPITNVALRDSMPTGVTYVVGSVSGTGVTIGAPATGNIVSFNIASIPASGFIDVTFKARAACSAPSAGTVEDAFRASWGGTFFTSTTKVPQPILFPSLSVTLSTGNTIANCNTKFVRDITVCNGGFAPVDSITVTDTESNNSITNVNMNPGTYSVNGLVAKTVLKASDFIAAGFPSGQLGQNQCIVVHDTLMITGSTTPVNGVIRADWGCNTSVCTNGTTNNVTNVSTTINANSAAPALTRTLTNVGPIDTSGQLFNRVQNHREVIKNSSTVIANNAVAYYNTTGLRYIDVSSFSAKYNNGTAYMPVVTDYHVGPTGRSHPHGQMGNVLNPSTYPGALTTNSVYVTLGDIAPGDSIVITFNTSTVGPITRVSDAVFYPSSGSFCGSNYNFLDGPSIGTAINGKLGWQGCPAGDYEICRESFPGILFNGYNNVAEPSGHAPLFLARFRGYTFVDSTGLGDTRCAYYKDDTVRVSMRAGVMDLPFFTDKSVFYIKIKTNGGVSWDGKLNRTFGRLTSWTQVPWMADRVVDNSSIDSTIHVYFKRSNLPPVAATNFANNAYKSYQGGGWQLNIGFVNRCPGPPVKRVRMTRVYDIDSTNTEPPIEAGTDTFPTAYNWNSNCPGPCAEGVQILNYEHKRITFDQPDNNNDGIPDATGVLDHTRTVKDLITWGDTMQLKTRMVVKTSQEGGVPYLYLKSSINYASLPDAITCNNLLKKEPPKITIKTKAGSTYTGTSTATVVNTDNSYLLNLSLQGANGISIPDYLAYQEGDTIDLVENIIYWTPHESWALREWAFLHVPYTSTVIDPTPPQQSKCDSVVCNFRTVDYNLVLAVTRTSQEVCSDSTKLRLAFYNQNTGAACGTNLFTAEVRSPVIPEILKMKVPVTSGWVLKNVRFFYSRSIQGTGQCNNVIDNILLSPTLYTFSGDTIVFNAKSILAGLGHNIDDNNQRAVLTFDLMMQRTATSNGCDIDHVNTASGNFPLIWSYKPKRPMDLSVPNTFKNTGAASAWLNTPNGPLAAGALVSNVANINVTTNHPVVNYSLTNTPTNNFDNKYLAIPDRAGITVDSVRDAETGIRLATTPGSSIYKIGNFTGTKIYNIYTTVTACEDDSLIVYADRSPCNGYPVNFADYACKDKMNKAFTKFITTKGELQMQDSIYTTQKDICTKDTVAFKVVNSQTPTARNIKISFKLPAGVTLNPGETQLDIRSLGFVTVPDPVLLGGEYVWTLPASDSLAGVANSPNNIMTLRCGIMTACGYTVGSIIRSSIAGEVACGKITSLFNTNPPTININGAPTLNYLSNVKGVVEQISGLNKPEGYDYSIVMKLSGIAPTAATDSVSILLPAKYKFVTYTAATQPAGSKNVPPAPPTITSLPNGDKLLSWGLKSGVSQTDSIKFTFKYNETSEANKCGISPSQNSFITTSIAGSAICATTGQTCSIGIVSGQDSVSLVSNKPSLAVAVTNSFYYHCSNPPACGKDYVKIAGTIYNNGSVPVAPGAAVIMEGFFDNDATTNVSAGDIALTPYTTTVGIPAGGSIPFTYIDTLATTCNTCVGKGLLLRFDQYPGGSPIQQQVLCDSSLTSAFAAPTALGTISLAGNVFNDANGNADTQGSAEVGELPINGTNVGGGRSIGAVLYANLVNAAGTVIGTVPVNADGTYLFPAVSPNTMNLKVQISTVEGGVNSAMPTTTLPANWIFTGCHKNSQGRLSGIDCEGGLITVNTLEVNITQQNFGIESLPVANDVTQTISTPNATIAAGTVTAPVSGSDVEDGVYGNDQPIKITALATNGVMLYNGVPVTVGQSIANFNPGLLSFTGVVPTTVSTSFEYTYTDNAGQEDPTPATYSITWAPPLPVTLISFSATKVEEQVILTWKTVDEKDFGHFEIQRSANAKEFSTIASVNGNQSAIYTLTDPKPIMGTAYYRLKMVDLDQSFAYSTIRSVVFDTKFESYIYPNPVDGDKLQVKVTDWKQVRSISITNVAGIEVYRSGPVDSGRLDIKDLTSGMYIVKITHNNGDEYVHKIIRLK